jgi:hypothetical protein
MNAAVDFDHHLLIRAVEVDDEVCDSCLPPKLSAFQFAIAQSHPQHLLTLCLPLPELPRSTNKRRASCL